MRVLGVSGPSGSGKTTAIAELICQARERGLRPAAIKHTHHPLNLENRGDTARFLAAGAEAAILASEGAAVLFRPGSAEQFAWSRPDELFLRLDADVIFVEGFKGQGRWPRLEIDATSRPGPEALGEELDRIVGR